MADVLCFQVLTPYGTYPSVNSLGPGSHKGSKKSPEYHELGLAVRAAAQAEMDRVGWETATYYVDVYWKRIVNTFRGFDPQNCCKVELDFMQPFIPSPEERARGLQPFAGVYLNDNLVRPHVDLPLYDSSPRAVDRICIAVFRLYPNILDAKAIGEKSARKPPKPVETVKHEAAVPLPSAGGGRMALLNGKPIPMAEAMALVQGGGQRRPPQRKEH